MAARNAQRLRWVLGLTGVVLVLLVGYTGYQALKAKDALETVATQFSSIAADLKSGDSESARKSLVVAQQAATEARKNTNGPGWALTSRLPGVGDDVEAVRTVADVTDILSTKVLPEVLVAGDKLDPDALRPRHGRIAIEPIVQVAPSVVAADREMQRQNDRVAALRPADLNAQLARPVEQMQQKLAEAASLSSKASYAVRLLPTMLGADGKRTYLVMFQNNAEVRATGGIPGAFATLTANHGRIALGEQGSASSMGPISRPVLPLSHEELDLYEAKMATYPQNVNFTPDFPRSAELARAMWQDAKHTRIDGVFSVDPVALSYMLKGTGPVALPAGQRLTAENAVPLLLNDVYRRLPDPQAQDAYFAAAARAVFDKVTSGAGNPQAVLEGVSRAASEGRIYAWSKHADEQRLLDQTALGGLIPRQTDRSRPFVGVFLNDGTGAKMQYYLDHRVDVKPTECNSEGRQKLTVTVTMSSNAPSNAAQLPPYIVGMARQLGIRPGSMRVNVHLYAPMGGWIDASTVDGQELPLSQGEHLGHPVGSTTIELAPGETKKLTYAVMTGLHQTRDVELRVTPGVRTSGVGVVRPSACSAS